MIDTAGPSDTIAEPVAQLFIIHTGLVPRLLCFLLGSLTPPSRFISQNRKPPPPAFPLEFAGSLAQHGNDITKRKK